MVHAVGDRSMRVIVGCLGLVGVALSHPARAADEEIQVYLNDINAPHEAGLELHVNDVLSGEASPALPGQESSLHRLRVTPEWSYALDRHFELGAYLPLTTLDRSGTFRVEGAKLRLKWMGSATDDGVFYGVNYEVGRVDSKLDANPWNNEVKLIGGWAGRRWVIGGNVNFDFALSGPEKAPVDVELAGKIDYKLTPATMIGIETYNGIGNFRDFGHFRGNDQATYLVIDTRLGKRFDLNAGIGKGYGTNRDDVTAKLILGMRI